MSSHTRALDATARLTGELTVDIIFLMRRKPWRWIAVAIGLVAGAAIGLLAATLAGHFTVFLSVSTAGVLAGLGMNVGSDFEFLAITPSRLLLIDSSRVIAHPVRIACELRPRQVRWTTRGPFMRVTIAGAATGPAGSSLTSSSNRERLQRMLQAFGDGQ